MGVLIRVIASAGVVAIAAKILGCTCLKTFFISSWAAFITVVYMFLTHEQFKNHRRTFKRDCIAMYRFALYNITMFKFEKQNQTIPKVFTKLVARHPNKAAFIFEGKTWTYSDIDKTSNKISRILLDDAKVSRGTTVAVLMETRPEYVCSWLGIGKIGCSAALINTNLRGLPLKHSLEAANTDFVICGTELVSALEELNINKKVYVWGKGEKNLKPGYVDLDKFLDEADSSQLLDEIEKGKIRDKFLYIYTSGTTGLPKAAVITNLRFLFMSTGVHCMIRVRDNDIIYDPLPLYHTAGGILGAGLSVVYGSTVVLRRKFSASNFFKDCIENNCTVGQYIGETCRYMLSAPPRPEDKQHKVRLMFGNGLRPQIWNAFVERFNVPQISEFYGSTEGNSNLVNLDSTVGAVGFVPWFARNLIPLVLIRCDPSTGEPARDPKTGLCIRCHVNEPGMLLGKIDPRRALSQFTGYADKKASEKKILRDVMKKGDVYFNSGDILIIDELGYFYFKDRTGDTFRWRGENVSTSEVEAVITNIVGLNDCVVYGVEVPHTEGRAGMAAIVDTNHTLNIESLETGIKKQLASYARPLFMRVLNEVPLTGTYKLKKRDLQNDGFDIDKINDRVYFLDDKSGGKYVPLSRELYDDIISSRRRL